MAITGKVRTLFTDKTQSEALFPKTKVSAISDENGVGLDSILSEMIYTGDVIEDATGVVNADTLGGRPASDFPTANEVIYTGENEDTDLVPLNADTLGGIPADEYATENFVAVKIAEAQMGGGSGGDIDLSGYATKDDLNGLTAEQVGARPSDWMPSASDVGAAPAGYGLGGEVRKGTHCDGCTESGFWSAHSGFPDGVDGSTHMGIVYRQDYWVYQEFRRLGTEAVYKLVRKKNRDTGEWQPWEWENPPMIPGVEYRTTERHEGKPVYVKAIDFGNLPNATIKEISHGVTNISLVLSCGGVNNRSRTPMPSSDGTANGGYFMGAGDTTIWVVTTKNRSTDTANVWLKYTKTMN